MPKDTPGAAAFSRPISSAPIRAVTNSGAAKRNFRVLAQRIEPGVPRQRPPGQLDQRLDLRPQFLGPPGRLEAVRAADEQRVVEQVAQTGPAHG